MIIIFCTMLVMLSSLTPFPINLCRYMKYLALGGVHPHLQTSYLQLALSDIMSLLLNNSFWAKTVTHSMDLLHVHGLLLHASHLLPLQYGPALSLRVHGDSAHPQYLATPFGNRLQHTPWTISCLPSTPPWTTSICPSLLASISQASS